MDVRRLVDAQLCGPGGPGDVEMKRAGMGGGGVACNGMQWSVIFHCLFHLFIRNIYIFSEINALVLDDMLILNFFFLFTHY